MDNGNYMPGIAPEPQHNEKGNFGWAVLGFFFPIIGLILFLVWKETRYGDAKKAGIGALVGFLSGIIVPIIISILFYTFGWTSVQNQLMQQTCDTYGEHYVARQENGVWECYDTVTKESIKFPDTEE